jgi:hypothetical protein
MGDTYQENRLWENDGSVIIAAAPRIVDDKRIVVKLAVGYKFQSTVHGLPSLEAPLYEDELETQGRREGRYLEDDDDDVDGEDTMRDVATLRPSRWWDMSPEEFDRLSESEQREVLRERYVRRRIHELRQRRSRLVREPRLEDVGHALLGQVDRLGWRNLLGVAAAAFGVVRAFSGLGR